MTAGGLRFSSERADTQVRPYGNPRTLFHRGSFMPPCQGGVGGVAPLMKGVYVGHICPTYHATLLFSHSNNGPHICSAPKKGALPTKP